MKKPVEIVVLGADTIRRYQPGRPHLVISISEHEAGLPDIPQNPHCRGVLRLVFWDVDDPFGGIPGGMLFHEEQAETVLDFVFERLERIDAVVCQCDAGISRSAALAAALSRILTGDDAYYFRQYQPNRLVYDTLLEVHRNRSRRTVFFSDGLNDNPDNAQD